MGALVTGIIQSSSASVGILQALSATGVITYGSAIPIIMGQNIGTCVTALLSSVGATKNARRAAMVHLYFNIIGVSIFLFGFYGLNTVCHFAFVEFHHRGLGHRRGALGIQHSGHRHPAAFCHRAGKAGYPDHSGFPGKRGALLCWMTVC